MDRAPLSIRILWKLAMVRCWFHFGHDWYMRDASIDAGRGYCRRCGLNDHIWLPLDDGA